MSSIDVGTTPGRTIDTVLPRSTWLLIIVLALVGQIAWATENNFFNLFIQDVFGASLSDVALMVSASAITATLTTLLAGIWSDRAGRRKTFIVAGMVLWGLSIMVFAALQRVSAQLAADTAAAAALGIALTITSDCVMTFFGSLANDACFNAWVTDITDETNRGRVEGVNSAMPLLAMLAVFGGAMFLMTVHPDGTVTYDYTTLFVIIGSAVIVVAVLALALMNDTHPRGVRTVKRAIGPDSAADHAAFSDFVESSTRGNFLEELGYGFRPSSMRANRMLYLVLLAYCIFSTALQVFMPYYVLYLRLPYILGENYVFVMAPGIIIAAVFTIFYGRRVDRRGFLRAVVVPLVLFVVGCLLLTFLASAVGVFAGSVAMLCGYLSAIACLGAEIRNNTPADRVGMFQGLRIFMVVLVPMLIGPWIGSSLSASSGTIAGFGVVGDGFTPSSLMFLGGAIVATFTFIVLVAIRRQHADSQ